MASKINPWLVIRDHYYTLYDASADSKTVSKPDLALFYLSPLVLVGFLVFCQWSIPDSLTSMFVNVTAIFIALLLNLIVLVDSQRVSADQEIAANLNVYKETTKNIAFAVFVSILILILTFLYSLIHVPAWLVNTLDFPLGHWGRVAISAAVAGLSFNLMLTLLMVLKRFHLIITRG